MRVRAATLDDLREMDALRRANQEAVGFIPLSKYEQVLNRLIVAEDGGDLTGFLYWTAGTPLASIQQVAVREDARRAERASLLVAAAISQAQKLGRFGMTCRCRLSLEATEFWPALGFIAVRQEQSGRRGPLVRFAKLFSPSLLSLGDFVRGPHPGKLIFQHRGFRLLTREGPPA